MEIVYLLSRTITRLICWLFMVLNNVAWCGFLLLQGLREHYSIYAIKELKNFPNKFFFSLYKFANTSKMNRAWIHKLWHKSNSPRQCRDRLQGNITCCHLRDGWHLYKCIIYKYIESCNDVQVGNALKEECRVELVAMQNPFIEFLICIRIPLQIVLFLYDGANSIVQLHVSISNRIIFA